MSYNGTVTAEPSILSSNAFTSHPWIASSITLVIAWTILNAIFPPRYAKLPNAPVVGRRYWFEPGFITRYRFSLQAWSIVHNGWQEHRDTPFTVLRPDANLTVLPRKYVSELQNLPEQKLFAIKAIVEDLVGTYTKINVLLDSRLGPHAVTTKLTPILGDITPDMSKIVNYSINKALPSHDQWTTVDFNKIALDLTSRMTAYLFVRPLWEDEEWLQLNIIIVEEIMKTVIIMRHFPEFLHPILGLINPTLYGFKKCMRRVHEILIPIIKDRQRKAAAGDTTGREEDILQWMIDLASEKESSPSELATRYVWTIVGSMHTVTAGIVDCIYDLCARPEYVEPLEEEVHKVLQSEGGEWKKGTAAKLQKLDSFMKEVQRTNPPSCMGFKRIVEQPITLSDGLFLPKNTYICVPTTSHQQNVDFGDSNPEVFDGFRYYNKRQDPGYEHRFQYSSTDSTHIHFGTGRYACPGRFAASVELKLAMARLLCDYDWRFLEGKGRPGNLSILELSFHDPRVRIQMKNRRKL